MSYRYNKQKRKKRTVYGILLVLLLLGLFTPFYSYIYDVLEKPFNSLYTNTAELKKDGTNFFATWVSKKKLVEENEKLEQKIALLEVDNLRTQYLESRLEEHSIMMGISSDTVFSSVIHKNNSGTITILGGFNDGFSIGDSVISYDGVLVGNISQVFDRTSLVDLFIKDSVLSYGILFPQDLSIEMIGNGNAILTEINRDVEVNVGDTVYSQDNVGYLLGLVSAIDFDPRNPFKTTYISPIHRIENLQTVGIIKTPSE